MLLVSCESKDKYVGVYKAEGPMGREIILELKKNGDGLWKVSSDEAKGAFIEEVSFEWYIKRGELRLNTKAGGVIIGKIDKDTIQMTMPRRTLIFKKIQ